MIIYKYPTGHGNGGNIYTTSPVSPGTEAQIANGAIGGKWVARYKYQGGRLYELIGGIEIDRGEWTGAIPVYDETGNIVRLEG